MNNYNIIRELNRGAFGRAYLINPKNNPSVQYVAKQIDISKATGQDIQSIKNEIRLLQQCNHPNVVKYKDSFVENNNQYIIMEYCDSGDLEKFLETQNKKGPLPEDQILCFFTQICLALKHVHDKHILHRDMKTANLFLTKGPTKDFWGYQIKLGDFGVSKTLTGNQMLTQTFVGTPLYMAPEILQDKPYNNKTDIWSIGCILYNMCTFEQMIQASTMQTLMTKARNNQVPQITDHYSMKIQQLLDKTVQSDPRKRATIQQLLELPQLQYWVPKLLTQEQMNSEHFHLSSQLRLRPSTAQNKVEAQYSVQRPQQVGPQQQTKPVPVQYQAPINAGNKATQLKNTLNYFTIGKQPTIPQAPTLPEFNATVNNSNMYPSNVQKQSHYEPIQINNAPYQPPNMQNTVLNEKQVLIGNKLQQSVNNTIINQTATQKGYQIPQTKVPIQQQPSKSLQPSAQQQFQERPVVVPQPKSQQTQKRHYGPQITQNYGQATGMHQHDRSPSPTGSTSDIFFQDNISNGFGQQLKKVVINQVQKIIAQYGQQQYDAWKLELKRYILFGQEIRKIPSEHLQLMMSVADFNML